MQLEGKIVGMGDCAEHNDITLYIHRSTTMLANRVLEMIIN